MARATKKTDAIAKWDATLAQMAQDTVKTVENVGVGGAMISFKGGRMAYKGAEIPGNAIQAIILAHTLHNAWYEGKFDPDNPQSPSCYAFGDDAKTMAPDSQQPMAAQQSEQCAGCPQNEWGTADVGRGKACKNLVRLALIADSDLEDVDNAEIAYAHVPVTSVRAWAGYVRQIAEVLQRPPLAVITLLKVLPDPKTQFHVTFEMVEQIDDGTLISQLIDKAKVAQKEITFPYALVQSEPAPARGRGRGRAAEPAVAAPARGRKQVPAPAPARRGFGAAPTRRKF